MLTYAICSYNRARRLPPLIAALRAQRCPVPWEILVVDNNSTDDTPRVLAELAALPGTPLRQVREPRQGIAHARNRALEEAMGSEYLLFIDDDELPEPGLIEAALDALDREGADCVGGRVRVAFAPGRRPAWLTDELLPFMAETDYGDLAFWVTDRERPMWTANIAYRMALFRADPGLRFDLRYNRVGHTLGGGEDVRMFEALMDRGVRIRYRPDMSVRHHVPEDRLRRAYFLRIHHIAGTRRGRHAMGEYDRHAFGIPPFLLRQALVQGWRSLAAWGTGRPDALRTAMNFTYALGILRGRWQAWRERARDGERERAP
jgi:glycosyltransferase involved in cell wall biosynthesis